jgi:PhzF family phenazine biosynthesis protein
MKPIPLYQVDAFTAHPFAGNPAAVCLLPGPTEADWMQSVAREMNLSETAFLHPDPNRDGWQLRWFTPAVEVDLCGHATLASAHTLWETGRLEPDEVARFHTRSGLLTARRVSDWIELNFPANPPGPVETPAGLLDALGLGSAVYVGRGKFDYLIEVTGEGALRAIQPDHNRLLQLQVRGVIVTARPSSDSYDFISRFFAPGAGINEDPVTGSAHCTLGPYWAEKLGRNELRAYQASARGGELRVTVAGDRVRLAGQAVTVLRGELV